MWHGSIGGKVSRLLRSIRHERALRKRWEALFTHSKTKGDDSMYRLTNGIKLVEEDSWEHGCLPETSFMVDIDLDFTADTLEDLILDVKQYFEANTDALELNACGEPGRLDIALMEDGDAMTADEYDIERWKRGEIKLYHCIYSFQLQRYELAAF